MPIVPRGSVTRAVYRLAAFGLCGRIEQEHHDLAARECHLEMEIPPSGGASSASGYTLDAIAGAKPQYPLPLKGRTERDAKEENSDCYCSDDAGG